MNHPVFQAGESARVVEGALTDVRATDTRATDTWSVSEGLTDAVGYTVDAVEGDGVE